MSVCVDSPDWRASRGRRESNRDQCASEHRLRVKRAILPAAISDWAVIRLLAEARGESRRDSRPAISAEIDGRQKQNSAYGPVSSVPPSYGASSSIGRALVCGTSGYGFEPRGAPPFTSLATPSGRGGRFRFFHRDAPAAVYNRRRAHALVAQWIEHWSSEPGVGGSNPSEGTSSHIVHVRRPASARVVSPCVR